MRHRLLLNLILACLITALGLAMWLYHAEPSQPQPITSLRAQAITHITLAFPKAESIELTRTEQGWRLRAPVEARARAQAIQQILGLVARLPRHRLPPTNTDAGKLGLDPPLVRVTFDTAKSGGVTVALGRGNPVHDQRYARVDGTVYLIASPDMRLFNADYSDLVARRLLPEDISIQRLTLPGATLIPKDDGNRRNGWMVASKQDTVGPLAADKTVALWRRTHALFVSLPRPAAPAQGRVTIETAQHGRLVIEILARRPQLLLRRPASGVIYHLASNLVAPLLEMQHPQSRALKDQTAIPLYPQPEQP